MGEQKNFIVLIDMVFIKIYNLNKIRQKKKSAEFRLRIRVVIYMANDYMLSVEQKIYSIEEMKEKGFSYYQIKRLVELGKLIKLNKNYYENLLYNGEESDFYYVAAYAPKGVICLMSAATYFNLTTYRPYSIDVAIPRKSKISTMPDWPQLSVFYYSDLRYETGIVEVNDGKNQFNIYDIEKTVTDIVYYREKIGIEETKEVLINYLHRTDRNLNRLLKYAEILKCKEILQTYLEVLI